MQASHLKLTLRDVVEHIIVQLREEKLEKQVKQVKQRISLLDAVHRVRAALRDEAVAYEANMTVVRQVLSHRRASCSEPIA